MTNPVPRRIPPQPWRQALAGLLLLALLAYAFLYILSGIEASRIEGATDLLDRAREFSVFRQGVYPMPALAPPPLGRDFPYSVYPPYALPLFAVFFGWGGAAQGLLLVQVLSVLSLLLIGWIGWRSLRFAGPAAGLLGAVAPLAIAGNSNCFFYGQFSILCMGLISLQWLLLERRRPLPAALCWAAAMLKPQIAFAFALPLLRRGSRRAFALGLALLLLLSAVALVHTQVSPLRYIAVWMQPGRLGFVSSGNMNLMALLGQVSTAVVALLLLAALLIAASLAFGRRIRIPARARSAGWGWSWSLDPTLRLQGLCAVLGALATYHRNYDNIMMAPALLAIFALALQERGPWHRFPWHRLLAVAMAITLWAPVHLTAGRGLILSVTSLIWLLVGLTLLLHRPAPAGAPLRPAAV